MTTNPYESPETTQSPGERERRWSWYDWGVLALSLAGTGHFAISVSIWGLGLYLFTDRFTTPPVWRELLHALPAVVLFGLFAVSAFRAWRRAKAAGMLLAAAVVLAAACFGFDAVNRNRQMHVEWKMADSPPPFIYFTWWWYDERWFQ